MIQITGKPDYGQVLLCMHRQNKQGSPASVENAGKDRVIGQPASGRQQKIN
jgi:hypothetical protein